MVAPRVPDLTTGNFLVEYEGASFPMTSVTGLGFEVSVIEDPEARTLGGRTALRSPGSEKHGLVTISTMELDKASKFGKWRNEVEAGLVLRKNLTVIMTDSAGVPVQKFHLMNAWPASVQIGSVPQGGEGWIQIDFGLAHEGITRE